MIDTFATTKNKTSLFWTSYEVGDYFYFGREDAGLPQSILDKVLKLVSLYLWQIMQEA